MGETAISVESIATEYLRLFDEGWNPSIDEFLGRVPEEMREECRQRIEELAALNGLDLSQVAAAGAGGAAPATDLGALAQEITPDGNDASGSAPRLRRAGSVLDEMSALAAQDKKKPGRRRSKRAPEPTPEPSSVHEGIEALAAIESVEVPEIQAEPELAEQAEQPPEQVELTEHTETQLVDVDAGGEAPAEAPPARPGRSRDEPIYAVPAQLAARTEPAKVKAAPRPPARIAAPVSDETQRDVLARLREVSHLERQGTIPAVESDRLHVIYRRLLDDAGAAGDLPITLPHLALYAFVAAAVAGAALFVALVHDAAPALQALVPGAIFLTLVGAGVRARSQGDGSGMALFFAAAAIAAAPAIVAGLAIAGLLEGGGSLPAHLSDLRLLAGTGGALLFAVACLLVLKRGLFAWVTAALAASAYGAMVLVLGVSDLRAHEIALRFLPLVLLAVPGLLLESQGKVRWAMPFHLVALAALLGSLDVMALKGGLLEVLGLGTVAGPARLPYLGFAAAGLVLAVLSLALERARSFDLRRAARLLQLVAAFHLVGALGWSAAVNGAGRDIVALGGASALLLVLGRFHRRPLLVAGGAGFVLALGLVAVTGAVAAGSFALALSGAGLLGALGIHFYLGRRAA
jgi:hypothetical protein